MTDLEIQKRMEKHWAKALELYPEDRIVGLFLQGSQNYYMEDEESDVDTKLLIIPSLEDIVLNKQPVSTTHILDNDEHMDAKDIRLYWQTMRKGNINFIELMFARVWFINPLYADLWQKVVDIREDIAYMNPRTSMKAMMGMINEKYFALTHRYPSRVNIIDKFGGYDPKQLHHLLRVTYFLEGYVSGKYTYKNLILAKNLSEDVFENVKYIKRCGVGCLEIAQDIANAYKSKAEEIYHANENKYNNLENTYTLNKMNEALAEFVKASIKKEIN